MKILKYLFFLFLIPISAFSQQNNLKDNMPRTNVDLTAKKLNSLSTLSYDGWKKSPNLSGGTIINGDPSSINFDDSNWRTLKINERVTDDSCWLRKEIILPEKILGQSVKGEIKLLISVDDYGYIWINGESKGYFPWDGEFILTKDAKPGEKFIAAVKVINAGGSLRILRAELDMSSVNPLKQEIQDLSLSLKAGKSF